MGSRPRAARRPPAVEPALPAVDDAAPAADGKPNTVTLGPRDRVVGQLYVEGDLRVGGRVDGEVIATGDVDIGATARLKASVAGREINVRGQVTGNVTARHRLQLAGSSSLTGDVQAERLVIQDGATFSGNISMGKPVGTAREPAPAGPPPAVAAPPPTPARPAPRASRPQPKRTSKAPGGKPRRPR